MSDSETFGRSKVMSSPGTVTLEILYDEVRSIKKMLEELVERAVVNVLPEEEVSDEEWKEIMEIDAEIETGEYVTLEEAERRYGRK